MSLDPQENYENEKFEEENKPFESQNSTEKKHRMRLSIDIHSLKDVEFRGLIYVRYPGIPSIGIKQFKTLPAIEILKSSEEKFQNSFCSHTFDVTKSTLYPQLTQTPLIMEVYHNDRLKKDILVGMSQINLEELLKCPIRKTSNSYARVYDAYVPVDEIDESTRKPLKKIASLRTIIYLEDLGPINESKGLLQEKNEEFENEQLKEFKKEGPVFIPEPITNLDNNEDDSEKKQIVEEMNSLEYKIVWELENWKKTEEMKFQMIMKQKEMEFLNKLNEEWKRKELEREKQWKRTESSINQIETKLKGKSSELQKREQKLVLLEEELKHKLNETIKILANKDEEIIDLRKKSKEERNAFEKEKQNLNMKIEEIKTKYNKLNDEYQAFKKDQENSPVSIVRNELSEKNREIKDLKKEIDKINQLKEEYKEYYEKMRNEIIKMKKAYETLKEESHKQKNNELEQLKLQIAALTMRDEAKSIKGVREDLKELKQKNFGFEDSEEVQEEKYKNVPQKPAANPFKKSILDTDSKIESFAENKENSFPEYHWNDKNMTEYEKLMKEKKYLLETGEYSQNDPLIIALENEIQIFKKKK